MRRVFIAGAYNADNICEVLNNIREGMRAGKLLLMQGFLPFNPFLDFFYHLVGGGDSTNFPTLKQYRAYCLELVDLSHVLYCMSGQSTHQGVIDEVIRARSRNIKIYYNLNVLIKAESQHVVDDSYSQDADFALIKDKFNDMECSINGIIDIVSKKLKEGR